MTNKTKIPWCDYTINPIKGMCPVDCKDNQGKSYCYARRMYKRFKWNEILRFVPSVFNDIPKMKSGSKVFVGSTMELFGDWIEPSWVRLTMERVGAHPELTFIFLTKQPQNLFHWSPFPENCWVGVSATTDDMLSSAILYLHNIKAKTKYISFEPLLEPMKDLSFTLKYSHIADWVIIGAQTPRSEKTFPKWEWVKEIIEAADIASIPVFLKPNLGLLEYNCEGSAPFYKRHQSGTWKIRQEFPDN